MEQFLLLGDKFEAQVLILMHNSLKYIIVIIINYPFNLCVKIVFVWAYALIEMGTRQIGPQ